MGTDRIKPSLVSEETIVSKLFFAFFSHIKEYRNASRGHVDAELLIKVLSRVYSAVNSGKFNRNAHPWISDKVINENFSGRKFNYYYKSIRESKIIFIPEKAHKTRIVFSAMCSISRDIYNEGNDDCEYISLLREELEVAPPYEKYRKQKIVFGEIETALKKITARPQEAISFDDKNQPIIKTGRRQYFPSKAESSKFEEIVSSRCVLYRMAFRPKGDAIFMREYIIIERRQHGITFRWETRGGPSDVEAEVNGVGFFSDDAFWMLGYGESPFRRLRVMTSSLSDWRAHLRREQPEDFVVAQILSNHDLGHRKVPISKTALIKVEKAGYWDEEAYSDRVKFLTLEQITKAVPERWLSLLS